MMRNAMKGSSAMNWSVFTGMSLLAGYYLLSAGAEPAAVTAGIALAGAATWWKRRRGAAH
jgi:hypothetical protein